MMFFKIIIVLQFGPTISRWNRAKDFTLDITLVMGIFVVVYVSDKPGNDSAVYQ